MDLILSRHEVRQDGIWGELYDTNYNHVALTLEHAYQFDDGFFAKVPPGEYKCVRGIHHLGAEAKPIETFEVTGVTGHWGILFHPANYDYELDGCIAPGTGWGRGKDNTRILTSSRQAFKKLMDLQKGLDEFKLTIEA